jgi:hypothetical protein
MIVSLFSGQVIRVTDAVGKYIDETISGIEVPHILKVPASNGITSTVKVSTINGIWADEQWEAMEHEKAGDRLCSQLFWHKRNEACGHQEKTPEDYDLSWMRDVPIVEPSTTKEAWMRLVQLNSQELKNTGRYGSLRDLQDLAQFEVDGKFPATPKPAPSKVETKHYKKPTLDDRFQPISLDGSF